MRVTGYKLNAKSIINDNLGKCLLSSLVLIFPKMMFAGAALIVWLAYRAELLNAFFVVPGILLSLGILFVLNSVCVPIGELMLFELADNENQLQSDFETQAKVDSDTAEDFFDMALDVALEFAFDKPAVEATKEFQIPFDFSNAGAEPETPTPTAIDAVRFFGFVRLLKLRFSLLTNLVRDVALTAFPAVLLVAGLLAYALYAPLPIGAFASFLTGSVAILLLAAMELGLEYDKYRYVYLSLPEFSREFSNYSFPYKSMLVKSAEQATTGIGAIRRCEVSFWGWTVFAFAFLPFLVPLLYFIPYKKLTFYNVIL